MENIVLRIGCHANDGVTAPYQEQLRDLYREIDDLEAMEWKKHCPVDVFPDFAKLATLGARWTYEDNGSRLLFLLNTTTDEVAAMAEVWEGNFPVLNVSIFVVAERFRGQGYSKLMMDRVQRYAKTQKCKGVALTVNLANAKAMRMYQKQGFKAQTQWMIKAI